MASGSSSSLRRGLTSILVRTDSEDPKELDLLLAPLVFFGFLLPLQTPPFLDSVSKTIPENEYTDLLFRILGLFLSFASGLGIESWTWDRRDVQV